MKTYSKLYTGMRHDYDAECPPKQGFMGEQDGKWSTCSRKEFRNHYFKMKSQGKWCLKSY